MVDKQADFLPALIATGLQDLVALADHSKANLCVLHYMLYGSLSGMGWMMVNESNLLPSFLIPTLTPLLTKQAKEMNKNYSLYIC